MTAGTFRSDLKARFPSLKKRLVEFEDFMRDYEPLLRGVLIPEAGHSPLSFPDKVRVLALSAALYARQLTATIIYASNTGLISGAYLAARAHFEVTGLLGDLVLTLERRKSGAITEAAAAERVHRLHLGRKVELEGLPEAETRDVTAINVMTLIDAVDKVLPDREMRGEFRRAYDWLSEFCHPNQFSRMAAGYEIDHAKKVVRFRLEPKTRKDDLGAIILNAGVSHALFFYFYDRAIKAVGGMPEYREER